MPLVSGSYLALRGVYHTITLDQFISKFYTLLIKVQYFLLSLQFIGMPFGQIPVLEVDGEVIAQSTSIARFLAKEFGLAGKDHLEQAQADMVVDACNDLIDCTSHSCF